MIEYARFGEGLRVDGPNWGRRAAPVLERPWTQLRPGIHLLGIEADDSALGPRLAVLDDGRGRLTRMLHPLTQEKLKRQGIDALVGSMMLADAVIPIDERLPFFPIVDTRISELGSLYNLDSVRLMGVVRYNPDSYLPRV